MGVWGALFSNKYLCINISKNIGASIHLSMDNLTVKGVEQGLFLPMSAMPGLSLLRQWQKQDIGRSRAMKRRGGDRAKIEIHV